MLCVDDTLILVTLGYITSRPFNKKFWKIKWYLLTLKENKTESFLSQDSQVPACKLIIHLKTIQSGFGMENLPSLSDDDNDRNQRVL